MVRRLMDNLVVAPPQPYDGTRRRGWIPAMTAYNGRITHSHKEHHDDQFHPYLPLVP